MGFATLSLSVPSKSSVHTQRKLIDDFLGIPRLTKEYIWYPAKVGDFVELYLSLYLKYHFAYGEDLEIEKM